MRSQASMKNKFSQLIQENQGILHKICRVYVNDPVEREDLFQEMCLQLWRSYPNFKQRSSFSTWLYRVALNTAIGMLRKSRKSIQVEALKDQYWSIPDPGEEKDQMNKMYDAISQLSQIEKALILLWLEEHSYEEISEILGISKSNVSVKLVRIRKKLIRMIHSHHKQ